MIFLSIYGVQANESDALSLDEAISKYEGKDGISEINALLLNGINAQDDDGRTALIWASFYGRTEIERLLRESGATTGVQTYRE